jgi:hypothetical protein
VEQRGADHSDTRADEPSCSPTTSGRHWSTWLHLDLDGDTVDAAHRGFLLALAHLALDDGKVSRTEKAELTATTEMLGVPTKLVTATLDAAGAVRHERLSTGLSGTQGWPPSLCWSGGA